MTADGFAEQAVRAIRAQVSYRVILWQMGIVAADAPAAQLAVRQAARGPAAQAAQGGD